MTIPSILLLFHLLISTIARINLFNGCSHYLEASQVMHDANRVTGSPEIGSYIEWNIWTICNIIFFVNRILLLLPLSRLALLFFIYIVCLIFFTLYCFSTLACANLVDRFACFDLRSMIIDAVPWSVQLFWKDSYFQRCRLVWSNIVG